MATNNVIELVVKLRDQASEKLGALAGKLRGFGTLALGIGGITGAAAALFKTVAASKEAEDTLLRFDIAFRNLGATSGKTRDELLRFADDVSKRSIFDDEKLLEAQAALLNFRNVSGATFDRARAASLDFAAALGTDLTAAATTVGRAIERPELAVRQLRSAGVIFTRDQEKMIRSLAETGQRAEAAEIVLGELERRFKGASAAASNTLSGALAKLRTAWENLFEVDAGPLTQAIDGLAKTLNDPAVRSGLQVLLKGFTDLLGVVIKLVAKTAEFTKSVLQASANFQATGSFADPSAKTQIGGEIINQQRLLRLLEERRALANVFNASEAAQLAVRIDGEKAYLETLKQRFALLESAENVAARAGKNRRGGDRGVPSTQEEAAARALTDELRKQGEALAAAVDPQVRFNQAVAQADELLRAGAISSDTYAKAIAAARTELDAINPVLEAVIKNQELVNEFESDAMDAADSMIQADFASFMEEVGKLEIDATSAFDRMADSFADAMERMLNNGEFSFKRLGQYLWNEVVSGWIKRAIDELRKSLKAATAINTSGGGFWGFLGKAAGAIFGGNAGGGDISHGPRWVGEEKPELLTRSLGAPVMRAYNMRQLAGMPAGGVSVRGGDVNVTVQGDTDERFLSRVVPLIEARVTRSERAVFEFIQRERG